MTRTRTTRYVTLLSFILALALTAALAACGSDEPSGVTGPDRTASIPTETPASPAPTPTTPGSEEAPTATVAPVPAAAPPAASPPPTPSTTGSEAAPTATVTPGPAAMTAPPAASGSVETDREALVALYNANGEYWKRSNNWLSDAPLGEWEGVVTNDDGRITELQLPTNDLSGEIPPELGSLSNLSLLNFNGNDLSGEIPAWLGSLSNLTHLILTDNDLSGEIPPELGSLSNLSFLYLAGNDLNGEIPPELGNLSNLTGLWLSGNELSGCAPRSLEDQLDFSVSDLGDLPYCPTGTPSTPGAEAAASGSVETDREALVALYNATDGENWNQSDNWLSDAPLGEWEGVVTNDDGRITEMQLHTNALSGEIPAWLGSLSNLTWLDLTHNELSGEIPVELGSFSNLRTLGLTHNELSGEIPPELGRSLCQMLWKLPPGGLAHQAAAPSTLTGNSAKIPSSNFAPSTSKPIRFLPPFSGRQRSLSLSDTLNTRYNALSRRFIRRVASVLNLTALNTDSRGFVVRRCTQCSTGKS